MKGEFQSLDNGKRQPDVVLAHLTHIKISFGLKKDIQILRLSMDDVPEIKEDNKRAFTSFMLRNRSKIYLQKTEINLFYVSS